MDAKHVQIKNRHLGLFCVLFVTRGRKNGHIVTRTICLPCTCSTRGLVQDCTGPRTEPISAYGFSRVLPDPPVQRWSNSSVVTLPYVKGGSHITCMLKSVVSNEAILMVTVLLAKSLL